MIEETVIFIQIIFIDIVMAADNAIIIGMVAANFAPKNRKKIILWGVLAAFVFRVIFAFSATYLFQFAFIKLIGGALLIELTFSWPGIAMSLQEAINQRDYTVVQGIVVAISSLVVMISVGIDIAIAYIDPRVSY